MSLKKKAISIIVSIATLSTLCISNVSAAYDPDAAAKYALKYANSYNTYYNQHSSDCTNFVSQCVKAGGIPQKFNSKAKSGKVNNETDYW
jgi:hypothetical protein